MVFPYFGVAGYSSGYANIALHRPPFPSLDLNVVNDTGFVVGGAIPLGPLSFGLAFKRITRAGGTQKVGPDALANATSSTFSSPLENKGIGYGIDAGLIAVAPLPMEPTLSLS